MDSSLSSTPPAMGCGTKLMKYVLVLWNLVFTLGGLALFLLGVAVIYVIRNYPDIIVRQVRTVPIILILAGIFVFTVAFLGCCGSIRHSRRMLSAFSNILIAMFSIQTLGVILALMYVSQAKASIKMAMYKFLSNYTTTGQLSIAKEAWDVVQNKLKCCGVDGPDDWAKAEMTSLPESCVCGDDLSPCNEGNYSSGCFDVLSNYLRAFLIIFGIITFIISIIEIFGIIFARRVAKASHVPQTKAKDSVTLVGTSEEKRKDIIQNKNTKQENRSKSQDHKDDSNNNEGKKSNNKSKQKKKKIE